MLIIPVTHGPTDKVARARYQYCTVMLHVGTVVSFLPSALRVAHGAGSGKKSEGASKRYSSAATETTPEGRGGIFISRRKSEGREEETKEKN